MTKQTTSHEMFFIFIFGQVKRKYECIVCKTKHTFKLQCHTFSTHESYVQLYSKFQSSFIISTVKYDFVKIVICYTMCLDLMTL